MCSHQGCGQHVGHVHRLPQCHTSQLQLYSTERGMKMFIVLLCAALLAGCAADEVTLCPHLVKTV